jgi:hypothetical protein
MFSTTRTLLYADNSSGNPDQSRSSDEGSGPEFDASDSGVESEPDAVKNIVAFTQGVRPSDLRWSKTEDNYVLSKVDSVNMQSSLRKNPSNISKSLAARVVEGGQRKPGLILGMGGMMPKPDMGAGYYHLYLRARI